VNTIKYALLLGRVLSGGKVAYSSTSPDIEMGYTVLRLDGEGDDIEYSPVYYSSSIKDVKTMYKALTLENS
jgi:hypothetical protein